ncbi:hypothetical protein [Chitinophaga pinensis]|uniref:Uncharacterized protein n=1 Tax=Chitinophaga pinensis (strain ATCC 43595 / DSM 2588 / LMG 13176 / NBRC 15968 / NCIMB 11800 / UQM 2034) TaxID=485918 RepID=A0A979GR84_CHIPD|nr:hypothetical protein [Chitinophaga pinensis]ACU62137.1 hypothetical protein Cpin_4700 [Chitinophaga pinensis DSM 2588]
MLRICFVNQYYVLLYVPVRGGAECVFTFRNDFLPAGMFRYSGLFPSTISERRSYTLNARENATASAIFRKLEEEDHSDYPYAKELQRTYLIELMHLLLKIRN